MTQIYRLQALKNKIEKAISSYSEVFYASQWKDNIEVEILEGVIDDDPIVVSQFDNDELSAMRELMQEGLWLTYSEQENAVVLTKKFMNRLGDLPINFDNITNGAD
jgi:hypothetical protein